MIDSETIAKELRRRLDISPLTRKDIVRLEVFKIMMDSGPTMGVEQLTHISINISNLLLGD